MVGSVDAHREQYGVEPLCAEVPGAPTTCYEKEARQADPSRLPARAIRDGALVPEIRRVWTASHEGYGAKKVWKQQTRETIVVARRTVARDFTVDRPNAHWVADLTYVAFVLDAFARRIVGWRVAGTLKGDLALDPLEQALSDRGRTAGSSILATAGRNIRRFGTPSVGRRRASPSSSAAGVTPTTTRWPKRSSGSSRRRSFAGAVHGGRSRQSSLPPSSGWPGTTRTGCWCRSATSRRPEYEQPDERRLETPAAPVMLNPCALRKTRGDAAARWRFRAVSFQRLEQDLAVTVSRDGCRAYPIDVFRIEGHSGSRDRDRSVERRDG